MTVELTQAQLDAISRLDKMDVLPSFVMSAAENRRFGKDFEVLNGVAPETILAVWVAPETIKVLL